MVKTVNVLGKIIKLSSFYTHFVFKVHNSEVTLLEVYNIVTRKKH